MDLIFNYLPRLFPKHFEILVLELLSKRKLIEKLHSRLCHSSVTIFILENLYCSRTWILIQFSVGFVHLDVHHCRNRVTKNIIWLFKNYT